MRTSLLGVLVVFVLASPIAAGNDLAVSSKFPVVGRDEEVRLTGESLPSEVRLKVVYRPNSETKVERVVGAFDTEGKLIWRPEAPGITVLSAIAADDSVVATTKVATCFASPPATGILVMVVAGILLFGGAALSLVFALSRDRDPSEP